MGTRLTRKYSLLATRVREDHITIAGGVAKGHDFLHALAVAQIGAKIAPNKKIAELAWVAGIIHNTDRIFPAEKDIRGILREYLSLTDIVGEDRETVIDAVLEHDKINNPHDSLVTIVLKDADRIVNLGLSVLPRSGQAFPKLPIVNPKFLNGPDPESTYQSPKTCWDDIWRALEWGNGPESDPRVCIRLPRAQKLAKPRVNRLRKVLGSIRKEVEECGLA